MLNTPKLSTRLLHQLRRPVFSLGTLCWSCPAPVLVPALPARPCAAGRAAGGWDPPAARPTGSTSPHHPTNVSSGPVLPGGFCSQLMPGPAEHLGESRLQAVACRHFAWCSPRLCWPGKFQLLLTVFFLLPFRLKFLLFSLPPGRSLFLPTSVEHGGGGHGHPSASSSTAVPARRHPSPWPIPSGALLASPVYNEEENALPQGCLSLTVLDLAP